jgi:Ca2+/Na+ antiporter
MVGREEPIDPESESVEDTMFVAPNAWWRQVIYYTTLPLKYAIYLTVPDVRKPEHEHKAILATLLGFGWLAIITYILIDSLSLLANILNFNDAVLGITIGAWAASYPAAWSSIVVARYGYGDIVVCNALGSNIFSNLIGLGLPWFLYVLIYQESYSAIQDQGAVLSIFGLMIVIVIFHLLAAWNKFVLKAS